MCVPFIIDTISLIGGFSLPLAISRVPNVQNRLTKQVERASVMGILAKLKIKIHGNEKSICYFYYVDCFKPLATVKYAVNEASETSGLK